MSSLDTSSLNKEKFEMSQPKSPKSEIIQNDINDLKVHADDDDENDSRYECDQCWFTCLTEAGLSEHKKSKHAEYEEIITQVPRTGFIQTVPKFGFNRTPSVPKVSVKTPLTPKLETPMSTVSVKPATLPNEDSLVETPSATSSNPKPAVEIKEEDAPKPQSDNEKLSRTPEKKVDIMVATKAKVEVETPEPKPDAQLPQEDFPVN